MRVDLGSDFQMVTPPSDLRLLVVDFSCWLLVLASALGFLLWVSFMIFVVDFPRGLRLKTSFIDIFCPRVLLRGPTPGWYPFGIHCIRREGMRPTDRHLRHRGVG